MPIISPKIPQGLEELMRNLAKQVIKENPENIYEFAAEYFENLLRERDGTVDQSYKKFATYKVYKKTKLQRKKRERGDDDNLQSDQSSSTGALHLRKVASEDREEKSIEKITLSDAMSSPPPALLLSKRSLSKDLISVSSESEINTAIIQAPIVDDEGKPNKQQSVNSEDNNVGQDDDDDIKNMVLDDEMAEAALKIQSTFRGHKVRQEMKEQQKEPEAREGDGEIEMTDEKNLMLVAESENEDKLREEIECEQILNLDLCTVADDNNVESEATIQDDQNVNNNEKDGMADDSVINENENNDNISNENVESVELNDGESSVAAAASVLNVQNDEIGTEECQNNKNNDNGAEEEEAEELANMLLDPEIAQATLKIQSAYRGHKVRRDVKDSDSKVADSVAEDESSNLHEAQVDEKVVSEESSGVLDDESIIQNKGDDKTSELNDNDVDCDSEVKQNDDLMAETLALDDTKKLPSEEISNVCENANSQETEVFAAEISNEKEVGFEATAEKENVSDDNNENSTQGSVEVNALESAADNMQSDNKEHLSSEMKEENEEDPVVETTKDKEKGEEKEEEAPNFNETSAAVITDELLHDKQDESAHQISKELTAATGSTDVHEDLSNVASELTKEEQADSVEKINQEEQSKAVESELQDNDENIQLPQSSQGKCDEEQIEAAIEEDGGEKVEQMMEKEKSVEEEICEQKIISYLEPTQNDHAELNTDGVVVDEDVKASLEKMSSTDIKYQQLRESIDQEQQLPDHAEKCESTNENSIDADSLADENEFAKNNSIEPQNDEQERPKEKLGNILQASISPFDLIDEVVNEAAAQKVTEIYPNESNAENKCDDDLDKIINPPLISLENQDETNDGKGEKNDVNNQSMDEVLKPEKEESEIPEDSQTSPLTQDFPDVEKSSAAVNGEETFDDLPLDDPDLQDAAVKIQAAFRGHQVRKDKEAESVVEPDAEPAADDFSDLPLDDPDLQDAAVKIQAAFRGHQVRKDKETSQSIEMSQEQLAVENFDDLPLDDPDLQDAAVKIQAAFRGHQIRKDKETTQSVELNNEQQVENFDDLPLDDPDLQDAAVKIQAAFRGHQVRKDKETVQSIEMSQEQPAADDFSDLPLDDPDLQDAAVKIQAAFRGHQVRKDKETDSIVEPDIEQPKEDFNDLPLDDPDLQDAAVKIQAAFRGHQVRKDKEIEAVKSPVPSKELLSLDDEAAQMALDDPELEEAATKIQAAFRGHQVRKDKITTPQISVSEINAVANQVIDDVMEEAATKIQAVFRGHQVRKDKAVKFNSENSSQDDSEQRKLDKTFVIENCSEAYEETQEQDETEQQDTSADVDEIQESETIEQDNNGEEESHVEEETNEQETETETNEQGGDDPTEPEGAEGESSEQQNQDDDDVANMVLDDEMEQAALKIQSTFRGHKTRTEMKSQQECKTAEQEQEEQKQAEVEEELANMLLDPEIADATLKIQSVFRGSKARKEAKEKKNDDDEGEASKEQEEEEKKEEEKQEEASSSSTEKTAQQLQEEEDIANLVMDDEMEKTALKIQSAFRGKIKRKPKDGGDDDSCESSAENNSDDEEEEGEGNLQNSEEQPSDIYEYFAMSKEYSHDEVDYNGYLATRQSYSDESHFEVCTAFDQTIYPEDDDDIHLMHGGGIFVEPSGEDSGALGLLTGNSGEDGEKNNGKEESRNIEKADLNAISEEELKVEKVSSELQAIESFDFKSNKDSAEAMYYSLKKNEIEAQKRFEIDRMQQQQTLDDYSSKEVYASVERDDEDDDDDVVVKTPPSAAAAANNSKMLKYRMSMDDSILSQHYSRQKMRNNELLLEKVHEMSQSIDDDYNNVSYTANDIVDEDEDQFDFYPGNIRSKIMASSVSIADSDYFDPTNNKSIIDDDTIRTALETIHSTDSESTIGSAATKIQVNDRNVTARRNNNFQYSSIGNAAIDKSLDDFIQSQELRIDRFDEEPEGYSSPPPKKQESCDDYTDDTCTESDRKIAGVIEIKLEQKHFLTVDERRRTLHREDAIQRNSTRSVEEESSKSSNASCDKNADKLQSQNDAAAVAPVVTGVVQGQSSIIDTEIEVPVLEKQQKSALAIKNVKIPMRRQKTMPVQIESNVIRVLPKHLRKRIKSAESEKKKRFSK